MDDELRELVLQRAKHCCEYCRLPQEGLPLVTLHVEHIIAKQHFGADDESNLAAACNRCNFRKGPNLSGVDPDTGRIVQLFHPRKQKWSRHFRWNGPLLEGRTQTGRATIAVLAINDDDRVALREELIEEGLFPPDRL